MYVNVRSTVVCRSFLRLICTDVSHAAITGVIRISREHLYRRFRSTGRGDSELSEEVILCRSLHCRSIGLFCFRFLYSELSEEIVLDRSRFFFLGNFYSECCQVTVHSNAGAGDSSLSSSSLSSLFSFKSCSFLGFTSCSLFSFSCSFLSLTLGSGSSLCGSSLFLLFSFSLFGRFGDLCNCIAERDDSLIFDALLRAHALFPEQFSHLFFICPDYLFCEGVLTLVTGDLLEVGHFVSTAESGDILSFDKADAASGTLIIVGSVDLIVESGSYERNIHKLSPLPQQKAAAVSLRQRRRRFPGALMPVCGPARTIALTGQINTPTLYLIQRKKSTLS